MAKDVGNWEIKKPHDQDENQILYWWWLPTSILGWYI